MSEPVVRPKRKTRPPARYGDEYYGLDDAEYNLDQPQHRSTPARSPREQFLEEVANVTREIEELKLDLAFLQGDQGATGATGGLKIDDPPPPSSSSRRFTQELSRDLRARGHLGTQSEQTHRILDGLRSGSTPSGRPRPADSYYKQPSRGNHSRAYPTLKEVRALKALESLGGGSHAPLPTATSGIHQQVRFPAENVDFTGQGDYGSGSAWLALEEDTKTTQQCAFALGTQANHKTQFQSYLGFCAFFKKPPFPATPHLLSCYAQFLSKSLKSPATVSHYLSSVKLLHQYNGHYDLDLHHPEVQLTLTGIKKTLCHRPKEPHPVTIPFLLRTHTLLDLSRPRNATLWAAILLGFFGFLRKSNLVPPTAKSFDPNKHLCRQDILAAPEALVLRASWSKTIQANERELVVPVLAIPGSPLCPVRAYLNMLHLNPAPAHAPAFILPPTTQRPLRPLTASTLDKEFNNIVLKQGLPSRHHTLHDLRRGGYTLAFEAGVPRELRQRHGDWRSDADLCYLRVSAEQRLRLPAAMRSLVRQQTSPHSA
ncbi:uncharacterized protein LOC144904857 [Branchiostoma floridae x Branchiostoma belcheri]